MPEDKQLICDMLLPALQETRALYDLKNLKYETLHDDLEVVTAYFTSGNKKVINVTMDSGFAMIRDIVSWIR